jgi:RNA polymerase sigma factor (sigma-70 family)
LLIKIISETFAQFGSLGTGYRSSGERGGQVSPAFADAKGGEKMKPHSHEEHIQHTFDTFCKKVLRNEARDYLDELARKRNREISFSDLPVEVMGQLSVCDIYFVEKRSFGVLDYRVYIDNDELAEAIAALPAQKRDIILLSYFLDMPDNEIAKALNMVRSSVAYRRSATLKLLRELMGGKADEQ